MNNLKLFYYSLPKNHLKYKTDKNIPKAVNKVQNILDSLKLRPESDIQEVIADKTKAHYSAVVFGEKNHKYFIKIKYQDHYFLGKIFERNIILNNILRQYPQIALRKFIPKIIEATENYVISEHIDGITLGNRYQYNNSILEKKHLPLINKVLDALRTFPVNLFDGNIETYAWDFFHFLIFELTELQANLNLLHSFFDTKLISGINHLQTNTTLINALNESSHQLCHGDFKPNNLILRGDNIYLIDWDSYSIGNRNIDIAYFFDKIYRQPSVQQDFILSHVGSSMNDQILQYAWLFAFSFSESLYLIKNIDSIVKKSPNDSIAIKKIYKQELDNTSLFFHKLIELI